MSRALLFVVGVVAAYVYGWREGYHFATEDRAARWNRVGPSCSVKWDGDPP